MIHVGEKLVLSLWAESAARREIGEVARGGTLPFTLAHNVTSPAAVDAVLTTARAAGATVHDAQQRDWGGYRGRADPVASHFGAGSSSSPAASVEPSSVIVIVAQCSPMARVQ
jgi:hypothetical protein